jgi:hypothetical protein
VWSDASEWGWGYLCTKPQMKGSMATHREMEIFVAELLAAADTLLTASREAPKSVIEYRGDNSAAVNAILRGHSGSGKGNLVLRRLVETVGHDAFRVGWVPSKCQMADGLSRGDDRPVLPCTHEHATHNVRWRC